MWLKGVDMVQVLWEGKQMPVWKKVVVFVVVVVVVVAGVEDDLGVHVEADGVVAELDDIAGVVIDVDIDIGAAVESDAELISVVIVAVALVDVRQSQYQVQKMV